MEDGGTYAFPEPIGEAGTIYTLHSEVRTFGDSFGCRECTFRLSLAPPVLERVQALVGATDEEIDAAAHAASPSSPHTVSAHVIEAVGDGGQVTVTAVTHGDGRMGPGRRDRVHRRTGGRGRAAAGARSDRRPRGAAPRALRPARGPVPGAGAAQL